MAGYVDMKLAGRRRNVERRGPRRHIRGYLMRAITDNSPLIEPTILNVQTAMWVLFDAYANDVLPEHYGGLLADGVMLASLEWLFSWPWHHGHRTKRLELAYRQFLTLLSEMPATLDCIDFEGPPDRFQITKTGGYPMGLGSEAGGRADIISHIMAPFGNGS